ncbi:histidine kinase [Streptomyces cacaoi]|uniref:sensor histidine kinase n=1 Tax=Streptomyces cacaoi TaxID=1898 RepID=UPI003CC83941
MSETGRSGTWPATGGRTGRPRAALLAGARGLGLSFLSLGGSLALFLATVVSLVLVAAGIGLFTTPPLLERVRAHANQRRLLAREWTGTDIVAPYPPLPEDLRGPGGQVRRCLLMLGSAATWRDVLWLLVDAVAGFVTALLPPALLVYGVEGWVMFLGVWRAVRDGYWYAFIRLHDFDSAVQTAALATALLALALYANPYLLKAHFLIARSLLAPTRGAVLARRVDWLYETRHDAVDSSAAELRRIERDLHDGAQARLVAMGMSLGTIEALVERDPAKAKELIAQARENSAEALTELRDLVRGIHPPVLAERGLPDALRALALRSAVPVEVDIELPGRFPEPVETAVYFAVSELLTNAAKHSGAERVWLDIHHTGREGMLRVSVTDNGTGGAALDKGSGLTGLERRLSRFDGVLAVNSPPGGPTMITLDVPTHPKQ